MPQKILHRFAARFCLGPDGLFFLVLFAAIVLFRLAIDGTLTRIPHTWADAGEYLKASRHDLLSLRLWAGWRSPMLPLLIKLCGGSWLRVQTAQMFLSSFAWTLLALAVRRRVSSELSKVLVGLLFFSFACHPNVTLWDRTLLSESLALSLFAILGATLLELAAWVMHRELHPRCEWIVLFAGAYLAAFALALTRDANALIALLVLALLTLMKLLPALRPLVPLRWYVCAAAALLVIPVCSSLSISRGLRWLLPLYNVICMRILPNPTYVAFFTERGMPLGEGILKHAGKDPSENTVEVYRLNELRMWIATKGRSAYTHFLITHPGHLLRVMASDAVPAMTQELTGYYTLRQPDGREWPWVRKLFGAVHFHRTWVLFLIAPAAVAFLWIILRPGSWHSPLAMYLLWLCLVAVFVFAAAAHGDCVEIVRHSLLGAESVRLAAWISLIMVLDLAAMRFQQMRAAGTPAAAESEGPPGAGG